MTTLVSELTMTFGLHGVLKEQTITDFKQLKSKRVGELWVTCVRLLEAQWYRQWVELINLMLQAKVTFKDCDPRKIDLKALNITKPLNSLSIQSSSVYRGINLYGPQALELYDYLTLSDLKNASTNFSNKEVLAALKQLLTEYRPEASLLKSL